MCLVYKKLCSHCCLLYIQYINCTGSKWDIKPNNLWCHDELPVRQHDHNPASLVGNNPGLPDRSIGEGQSSDKSKLQTYCEDDRQTVSDRNLYRLVTKSYLSVMVCIWFVLIWIKALYINLFKTLEQFSIKDQNKIQ